LKMRVKKTFPSHSSLQYACKWACDGVSGT
jgi:hypothetical protein